MTGVCAIITQLGWRSSRILPRIAPNRSGAPHPPPCTARIARTLMHFGSPPCCVTRSCSVHKVSCRPAEARGRAGCAEAVLGLDTCSVRRLCSFEDKRGARSRADPQFGALWYAIRCASAATDEPRSCWRQVRRAGRVRMRHVRWPGRSGGRAGGCCRQLKRARATSRLAALGATCCCEKRREGAANPSGGASSS